jgi:hypothetical protein
MEENEFKKICPKLYEALKNRKYVISTLEGISFIDVESKFNYHTLKTRLQFLPQMGFHSKCIGTFLINEN